MEDLASVVAYSRVSNGQIVRTVPRSDGSTPTRTVLGRAETGTDSDNLPEVADRLFLRKERRPANFGIGREIRVADLFCGCGAMSVGVREACRALRYRFSSAGAFDLFDTALQVYAKNFNIPTPKPTDLGLLLQHSIDAETSPEEVRLKRRLGRVDFVIAGPPCQGHSNLNNVTRRNDPKNELYFCVARFAKLFAPTWIVIENVSAVLHDKRDVVGRTIKALKSLSYDVEHGVVDTTKIGVPQTRRRHVLVAAKRKGRKATENHLPTVQEVIRNHATTVRNLKWAIGDLCTREKADGFDAPSSPKAVTQARIDYLFDHELYELPDSQRPDCHRLKAHRYQSVYGRMHWEMPAPTITGGFDTMGRGRFVHPGCRRTITPHEAARIQFFPDWFDFSPALRKRSRLVEIIGNAVPPKLSYVLALELMR